MTTRTITLIFLALANAAMLNAGTNMADQGIGASISNKTDGIRLVFSDDFDRPDGDVGKQWNIRSGSWVIKDRSLWIANADGATIVCTNGVGKDIRLEFDCLGYENGDCNAVVALNPGKDCGNNDYLFGFGDEFLSAATRCNKIVGNGKEMAKERKYLPIPGKWHHVVVEKRGTSLKMLVDNETALTVSNDARSPDEEGDLFAFWIWGSARIRNVKAFVLPKDPLDKESAPIVNEYTGFEEDPIGQAPRGFVTKTGAGASILVADVPNWDITNNTPVTPPDKCVRIEGKLGAPAELRKEFTPIESGFLEMDVMAESYKGEPIRISLLGEDDSELAVIYADETGTLCAAQGTNAPLRMEYAPDAFRWRGSKERVYLRPMRWFTLRVGFRCAEDSFYVSLLNYGLYYTPYKPKDQSSWMELGKKLQFIKPGKSVKAIRIATVNDAVLYADNFCVYGPTRPGGVNGMNYRLPAKTLLGLKYPDRRDPLVMKTYSYRFFPPTGGGNPIKGKKAPEFIAAGERYSALMIKQAFVNEDMQTLDRIAFYRQGGDKPDQAGLEQIKSLSTRVARTEALLDDLYRGYAGAFLNRLDKEALRTTFSDSAAKLEVELDETGQAVKEAIRLFAEKTPARVKPLLPAAAGGSAVNLKWNFKKGCYMEGTTPAYLHPVQPSAYSFFKLLDIGCHPVGAATDDRASGVGFIKRGDYLNYFELDYRANNRDSLWYGADYTLQYQFIGLYHNGSWSDVPHWWQEQYGTNADIYLQDAQGKRTDDKNINFVNDRARYAELNIWNPSVREWMLATSRDVAKYLETKYPGRTKLFTFGGEENIHPSTGLNPSARLAFGEFLKENYKDIAELNSKWQSNYKSFDEIVSGNPTDPVGPGQEFAQAAMQFSYAGGATNHPGPSGLAYEFYRFRTKGYCDMIRTVKQGVAEFAPDIPVSGYAHGALLANNRYSGADPVAVFEALDIFTFHSYAHHEWQQSNRYMDSLRKVHPGKGTGILEWGAGHVNNGQICDEECNKANGLAMLFDSMMWGHTLNDIWLGWSVWYGHGEVDPRLADTVLLYSASFMPLTKARIRKLGRPALEYPTIPPDVAVLEIASSFYNQIPDCPETMRPTSFAISWELEKRGWNFGYLFEKYLLDGRQSMKGIQTIIVPMGVCCPPELAEAMVAWTKAGGHLILAGPAGFYDQYGKPDNRLLKEFFGYSSWKKQEKKWAWDPESAVDANQGVTNGVYETAYGKGRVAFFSDLAEIKRGSMWTITNPQTPRGQPYMTNLLDKVATYTLRKVACDNPDFKYVVREAPDAYFVYVVNINARPLEGPGEGEISLALPVVSAADMGIEPAVSVPLRTGDGMVSFKIRLAQGEGTLIRLTKKSR